MCNCGKRTQPAEAPPAQAAPPATSTPTSTKDATAVVASGTGRTQSFAFIPPFGRRQNFGSRLEAEAARVRAGGSGQVVAGR
jgi:hypothetical protein